MEEERASGAIRFEIDAAEQAGSAAGEINQILRQALELKASDIHLEPQRDGLLVRFRCDGTLQKQRLLSSRLQQQILKPD